MQSALNREYRKMFRNLNGMRTMNRLPECLVIIDPKKEKNAVSEARKLGIATVALIDTDCDPDLVDLPIPGNDDSIRSIELIVKMLADAIVAGKGSGSGSTANTRPKAPKSRRPSRAFARICIKTKSHAKAQRRIDNRHAMLVRRRDSFASLRHCVRRRFRLGGVDPMAEITAAVVMKLRDETGLPMMDCKKALQEASGDFEAGQAERCARRARRSWRSVRIAPPRKAASRVYASVDPGVGAMVELQVRVGAGRQARRVRRSWRTTWPSNWPPALAPRRRKNCGSSPRRAARA